MRHRIATMLLIALLALGAVACDDTSAGLEEDAQDVEQGAEDLGEDVEAEAEDLGEDVDAELEAE